MNAIRAIIRAIVGLAILTLAVRTFVAIGWVQPIVVTGGSMAPHYTGESLTAVCSECGTRWPIDRAATEPDACPECHGTATTSGAAPADQIVAKRVRSLRGIRRWDTVLLRSPEDSRQLLLKRVVGLPGEHVALAEGDVWIDGRRITKSLADQLRLRVPLSTTKRGWHVTDDAWSYRRPITDNLPYNAHVSRRLRRITDRMVSFTVAHDSVLTLSVSPGYPPTLEVLLSSTERRHTARLEVWRRGDRIGSAEHPYTGGSRFVVSTFDHQLAVAIDSTVVLKVSLDTATGTAPAPVRLRGEGFDNLRLDRDIYYESQSPREAWTLRDHEWFVVGDNQAISRDSRNWSAGAGVPGRLIVGVVDD